MRPLPLAFAALLATSCGGHRVTAVALTPRFVSLQIEVYDPATNYVWQGVDLRVLEATLEWSGLTVANPRPNTFFVTDDQGLVTLDPQLLAEARIGFVEDQYGRALIEPQTDRDEGTVRVELSALGFPTVMVDVPISWQTPDVFVSVPFSPLP